MASYQASFDNSLAKVIDKEDGIYIRPYSYTSWWITKPLLFEEINEEIELIPQDHAPVQVESGEDVSITVLKEYLSNLVMTRGSLNHR